MRFATRSWSPLSLALLVVSLLCCGICRGQSGADLFDTPHSLAFARFLEQQRRFELAIAEYERIEKVAPGKLEVRLGILRNFALANRPVEGIVAYEKWDAHPAFVPAELRNKYIGLHFQSRDFERLQSRMDGGMRLNEPEQTRVRLHLALYQTDWRQARKLFETFEIQHVKQHRLAYAPVMDAVDDLHYRKPWLGAVCSLVPGGGQVYAGQWVDGLSSLFLVGVTGFEAYRLFHKRGPKNVLAWGLAGISTSFYIANLYGGQRAVKRYNEKKDAGIQQILDGVTVRDF